MRLKEIYEDGRIVKGVNTTADVGTNEIPRQAAKFGNKVDKDGRPPTLSKKVKGKSTNVLYNLGLAESKSYSCPRTKASKCQCESVNSITEAQETVTAVCELYPNDGVEGTILFKQQPNKPTLIIGEIKGLSPGEHGFHIHEFGDLSKGCESAGGHYNPDGVDHGDLSKGHVGDLGNITADENGIAQIRIVAERVDLLGERSVVGRSVVVHSDVDDLGKGGDDESLKTGNAGDRLACGVIVMKETVNETTVYLRDQLPQIKNKQLLKLKHTIETIALADIIPVQEERIVENFKRQVDNIVAGNYKPIIVDCNNKIVNGHHRYTALEMLGYETIQVAKLPWTLETILEKWSAKYKRSINCSNPKGFSQKAHCAGRKKNEEINDVTEGKLKSKSYRKALKAAAAQGKRTKKKLRTKFSEDFVENRIRQLEAAYEGNIGIMELMKFFQTAPKELVAQVKELINQNQDKEVWRIVQKYTGTRLKGKEFDIEENFADGKKKGKSRPGRVKRAGASCNGSVTALRKRAKNASGEKAKMYHWCANMKSGRKK